MKHCRSLAGIFVVILLTCPAVLAATPAAAEQSTRSDPRTLFPNGITFPVIKLADGALSVDTVEAVRTSSAKLFRHALGDVSFDGPTGMARKYRRASPEELDSVLLPKITPAARSQSFHTTAEGIFNLWQLDELRASRGDNLGLLAFDIEAEAKQVAALGVGSDYAFAVFINGKPVYTRLGYDSFRDSSSLIEAPLVAGRNRVTIAFEAGEPKIRRSYFLHSWTAKIRVFQTVDQARLEHARSHNHPLDTPIVSSLDGLRCQVGAPFISRASAVSLKGENITSGDVMENGAIHWSAPSRLPSCFYLSIDDGLLAEPVIIVRSDELEKLSLPHLSNKVSEGWAFRVRHLLEPEYRERLSDIDWVRKFANAYASSVNPTLVEEDSRLWCAHPRLASYESHIDGTRQPYLYYLPRNQGTHTPAKITEKTPIVVIAPTVTEPVRPVLESPLMAAQTEQENWCAVADEYGCILLWPGYNEVDFGGSLSMEALAETLREFTTKYNISTCPTFVMGVCSSGVAATRFAKLRKEQMSGVILYSPQLVRSGLAHWPKLRGALEDSPSHYSEAENNLLQLAADLRPLSCTILFDSGLEGHGSRGQTDTFIQGCRAAGTPVVEIPSEQSTEWVWGERMKSRFQSLLGQAFQNIRNPVAGWSAPFTKPSGATIKETLLSGYSISATDERLHSWLSDWNDGYRVWRSAEVPIKSDIKTPAQLATRVLDPRAIETLFPQQTADARGQMSTEYFGAYVDNAAPYQVVIFCSQDAKGPFPAFDPLLDGVLKSCLWKSENGRWQRVL